MFEKQPAVFGVLASGRGSNFEALLRYQQTGGFHNARIVCLVANRPSAGALDIARQAGLPAHAVRPKDFSTPEEYEQEIIRHLDAHNVNALILAGYMKIIGPTLLNRYADRIINIHPSLLPSFPGLHAQKQALDHGVRFSGCTVHFVDAGLDSGPIIGQSVVPVFPRDTEETLSARILEQEHKLFAQCICDITQRPWHIDGRRVIFDAPRET